MAGHFIIRFHPVRAAMIVSIMPIGKMSVLQAIVHTEKLDGENNCLSRHGVFARSHAAPTTSPWSRAIRERWERIKNDLGDAEIFGENLYAIHSIEYRKLQHYFYVFGVRIQDVWLGWDEVKFYATLFDFPVVPELGIVIPQQETAYREGVLALATQQSALDSFDIKQGTACTCEGIVSRNMKEYNIHDFAHHVFKYVRRGHVKTDEHWTRHWRRAKLNWEYIAEPKK
jgi:hypothetical protein